MPITFQHWPWLILFVPVLLWLVGAQRRSLADLPPGRRRASLVLRILIASLLIGALAGATLVRWNDSQAVWFVVDASESVTPDHRQQALRFATEAGRSMRRGDQAGIILFGGDALIEAPLADRLPAGKPASTPRAAHTDIAGALRLALAALPRDYARRIVLLSDGNETLGDAVTEVALAAAEGVPVDVVPLERPPAREALLDRVVLPSEVKLGEPFELRVTVHSDIAQEVTLRLFRDNTYREGRRVTLAPGANGFVFPQTLDRPGFAAYEVRLEPTADGVPENNRALGFTVARGRPRILYVEGDPGQASYLAGALRSQKIETVVTGPAGIPRNLAELQAYDSLILSNVSALHLSPQQMKMIQANVRDLGQGLVMIGGEESFGAGGYLGTPIEAALPVDMDVTKRRDWPSTAVVCVIDKSGSMASGGQGFSKVDLAKEAAIAAVEVLDARDQFGVVGFDEDAKEVVPLQPVKDRAAIQERVATIEAGGGTSMYPAMMMAHEWLKRSNARVKHCILLTDGQSAPGDFEGAVAAFGALRATVSAVAIGTDSDRSLLERLAQAGGGRFYYTDDAQALPRIFTKETLLAAKSLISEEPFLPRVDAEAEVLRGISWNATPPLLGYVATTAKSLAEVPLRSPGGDPVLAAWRHGLGRAVAFTSDCKARWGAQWVTWPGYQKFWGQCVRWTLRRSARSDMQTVVDVERGRGRVVVDALDANGEFANSLEMRANVVRPDMTTQSLPLQQTGPGRYEGEFGATATGVYLVSLTRLGPGTPATQTAGFAVSYPPEYRDLKADTFLLQRVAERTGGRLLQKPEEVFSKERKPARVPREIWPGMLLAALLLFPLDVALRRVMLEPAEVRAWLRAHAPKRARKAAPAAVPPPSDPTLDRLRTRAEKRRAESEDVAARREDATRVVAAVKTEAPKTKATPTDTPADATGEEADLSPTERLLRAKQRIHGNRE